jgi:hypothetical protein
MTLNLKRYILFSFIGLLCINNINKINGASILKLVRYNNEETNEKSNEELSNKNNYNQNNINNHININININKVNDTKNNKKIDIDINNKNNKTTELINETNENKIQNNKVERLDSKEILGKNYTTIGNIVKQSIIYDKNINNFLGEVIIHYNNTYHNHHYCKINIVISEKINVMYIRKYIYNFYNFDRQIKLVCNYYDCIELFDYKKDMKQYEFYKCNILNTIQLKDEL